MLWIWDNISLPSTSLLNSTRYRAEEAFREKKYDEAAEFYRQIVDGSMFSDPAGRMNMANAYYLSGKKTLALEHYRLLTRVEDKRLASAAHVQLAQLAVEQQDTLGALTHLKEAILLDRGNRIGIANFEVLKYHFSGKEPEGDAMAEKKRRQETVPEKQEQRPDPESPEGNVAEKASQRDQLLQNLDRMNMSEEQAQAILDAMKVNEMQYIYQLRRFGNTGTGEAGQRQNSRIEW